MTPFSIVLITAVLSTQIMQTITQTKKYRCISLLRPLPQLEPERSERIQSWIPKRPPSFVTKSPSSGQKLPLSGTKSPSSGQKLPLSGTKSPSSVTKAPSSVPKSPSSNSKLPPDSFNLFTFPLQLISSLLSPLIPSTVRQNTSSIISPLVSFQMPMTFSTIHSSASASPNCNTNNVPVSYNPQPGIINHSPISYNIVTEDKNHSPMPYNPQTEIINNPPTYNNSPIPCNPEVETIKHVPNSCNNLPENNKNTPIPCKSKVETVTKLPTPCNPQLGMKNHSPTCNNSPNPCNPEVEIIKNIPNSCNNSPGNNNTPITCIPKVETVTKLPTPCNPQPEMTNHLPICNNSPHPCNPEVEIINNVPNSCNNCNNSPGNNNTPDLCKSKVESVTKLPTPCKTLPGSINNSSVSRNPPLNCTNNSHNAYQHSLFEYSPKTLIHRLLCNFLMKKINGFKCNVANFSSSTSKPYDTSVTDNPPCVSIHLTTPDNGPTNNTPNDENVSTVSKPSDKINVFTTDLSTTTQDEFTTQSTNPLTNKTCNKPCVPPTTHVVRPIPSRTTYECIPHTCRGLHDHPYSSTPLKIHSSNHKSHLLPKSNFHTPFRPDLYKSNNQPLKEEEIILKMLQTLISTSNTS